MLKRCVVHGAVEDGIVVNREGNLTLEDTVVEGCAGNGIAVVGGSKVQISRCTVKSCGENGLAAIGQSSRRGPQTTVSVSSTTIERSGSRGVWADEGAVVKLDACNVRESGRQDYRVTSSPRQHAAGVIKGVPSELVL